MFGKIVQIIEQDKHNEVVYGINDPYVDFATIHFGDADATKIYIKGGHLVKDKVDGFKDILIFNGNLDKDAIEEYLLVIIPYAKKIGSNLARIAGRYYTEAIFEMKESDTVTVNDQTFMAVRAGNELFLVKKYR